MPTDARSVRFNALRGLSSWGDEAAEALPDLKDILDSEKNPLEQVPILRAIAEVAGHSPEAAELLSQFLKGNDATIRSLIAMNVSAFLRQSPSLVPLLIENIKRTPDKPYNELLALGKIGTNAAAAVFVVMEALKDSATRNNAVTALKGMGEASAPAVPALLTLLNNGELKLNCEVIEVLMKAGPSGSNAIPYLKAAATNKDPVMRIMATVALGKIQQNIESAVPILISELRNTNVADAMHWQVWLPDMRIIGLNHQMTSAWFLGEIGPAAGDAVPVLEESMGSKQSWLSIVSARAIWKIRGQSDGAMITLSQALQKPDDPACVLTAQVLGEIGTNAIPAVPALLNARTNSLYIRRAVNEALKKIDPETAAKVIHRPRL